MSTPAAGRGRCFFLGFSGYKTALAAAVFHLPRSRIIRVDSLAAAAAQAPTGADWLILWGRETPEGLGPFRASTRVGVIRMEDGFVRSVGLGADAVPPLSLVADDRGIYFDPSEPSGLERLLSERRFTDDDLQRASAVRAFITGRGITKYNIERLAPAHWPHGGRQVVFVPGQVEDDASIIYGAGAIRSNLALIAAARAAHPDAFLVYKPHPDVSRWQRQGAVAEADLKRLVDHVETSLSLVSCVEAADVVHTMTSLAGFDALLRGKRVVTHGVPFYAGWGLTDDRAGDLAALRRRTRRLVLDELVAGALLHYPTYHDWRSGRKIGCEEALRLIVAERTRLELQRPIFGAVRRRMPPLVGKALTIAGQSLRLWWRQLEW